MPEVGGMGVEKMADLTDFAYFTPEKCGNLRDLCSFF